MSSTTSAKGTGTRSVEGRPPTYAAGTACAVGATVLTAGGVVGQIVAAGTSVSTETWRYPWSSGTFVVVMIVVALAQCLLVVGVLGLRRSGVAGPGRAVAVGLASAVAGTALIAVGELASIPVRDQTVDDTGALVVGLMFFLGTVLTALGFLLAGAATVGTATWRDGRRFVPLAIGVWSVAMLGLQFTPLSLTATAVYSALFIALGVALMRPATVQRGPADQRAVQLG
jgi:hypothetical protein